MKIPGAGLQDGVDVAAAVAALRRIIKAGLHLEFLDHVGAGQRRVPKESDVVIGRADAFDQVVVVVLALTVHGHVHVAAAQRRAGIEVGARTGRKGQQLLKVLRGQRKRADRVRAEGLAGDGTGGLDRAHLGGDLHVSLHRAELQCGGDPRHFRHADGDSSDLGLSKALCPHHQGIGAHGQQECTERAIRPSHRGAHHASHVAVHDLHIGAGNDCSARIQHRACDGAGGAALRQYLRNRKKKNAPEDKKTTHGIPPAFLPGPAGIPHHSCAWRGAQPLVTGISVLSFPSARKLSPPAPSGQPHVALAPSGWSRGSSWPFYGASVLVLPAPVCLAAVPRWMASERSFAFCPYSLIVRQPAREHLRPLRYIR